MLLIPLSMQADIVNPIRWEGREVGDSVELTATIDDGWYLSVIELAGESVWDETEYRGQASFMVPKSNPSIRSHACNDVTCLSPEVFTYELTEEKAVNQSGDSLWWIFLMGLLAGLLAIFTPCVWPIIPMTVSFFIKKNGAQRGQTNVHAVRDAVLYGLSIVIIYVVFGLLITLIFGASALNALSTNAVVNLIFFALLVVFAASFFGAFEITLPSSWSTGLSNKSSQSAGFLGILFMAGTLVIVSFSCTGPIIGTLLVEAAGGGLLAPTIGMLGFSLALALPFTLFAMFPTMMSKLPRSGGWMNTFKVSLAFLELALSLKFFSVADLAYGWHLLDRETFIALWIAIFGMWGMYLLGLFKLPGDSDDTHKISVTRLLIAIFPLAFSLYMLPGLWGAPLRAISAFAPPISTQDWVLTEVGAHSTSNSTEQGTMNNPFRDLDEAKAYAQTHNKPLFIDFNGYGCVNCRKMEAAVLHKPEVQERIAGYVFVSLIVDDKTKLPEPMEVEENGKIVKLTTVGDKWSYYQRVNYQANAQPYYVQLNEQGELIGTPGYGYDEDIQKFLNWLER